MWPELAAILLSIVGLMVTAYFTDRVRRQAVYGNWIVVAGLVIQLVIVGARGLEKSEAPAVANAPQVDRSCDAAQIKTLADVEFITTRTTEGGLGNKWNVTGLDDKKVDARLKTLSELVVCLNQRLQPGSGDTRAAPSTVTGAAPPPP
jgi:hypothetical protein